MPLTVTSFSSRVESTSGGAATGDPATDGAATADGTPISAAIVTAVAARRTRCIAPPDSRQRPSHGQPLAYPPSDEPGQRVHGAGRPPGALVDRDIPSGGGAPDRINQSRRYERQAHSSSDTCMKRRTCVRHLSEPG